MWLSRLRSGGGFATYELAKIVFAAAALVVLVKKGEPPVVEYVEEFIPRHFLESFFRFAEIDPEEAAFGLALSRGAFDA
jgi:hypothetical protein